jgi:pSer/pThr/pTyr-binding forkhead associated (FHA) protein
MKLSLVVNHGKTDGKEVPIRLSQFLIGRDPECQLRPASPLVSKRHCAILIRNGKAYLRDFDSTNGTIVNGQPLKGEIELQDGMEFSVGPLGFRVKLSVTASPTPVPTPIPAQAAATIPQPASNPAVVVPSTSTPKPHNKTSNEEDAVAEMLLNLEAGPVSPDAGMATGSDPIPQGSTIMESSPLSAEAGQKPEDKDKPPETKKTAKKQYSNSAATSDAAKAILDKYMRRPRA